MIIVPRPPRPIRAARRYRIARIAFAIASVSVAAWLGYAGIDAATADTPAPRHCRLSIGAHSGKVVVVFDQSCELADVERAIATFEGATP